MTNPVLQSFGSPKKGYCPSKIKISDLSPVVKFPVHAWLSPGVLAGNPQEITGKSVDALVDIEYIA